MSPTATPHAVLLLGRDHEEHGRLHVERVSAHTACAISAGATADAAPKQHPNEDALLVLETDRHTVLAVADAHFGRQAGEEVLGLLATELVPVPENPERLAAVLDGLARQRARGSHGSESSLAVCILDRLFRQAFGVSFGDSSVMRTVPGDVPRRENEQNALWVTPAAPRTLASSDATTFAFSPAPGDLILVHTDGVDECCYGDPDRSVTPAILGDLLGRVGDDPERVARELGGLALRGVGGHPGGEDNLALAVTRA